MVVDAGTPSAPSPPSRSCPPRHLPRLAAAECDLAVIGHVNLESLPLILKALELNEKPVLFVASAAKAMDNVRARFPQVMGLREYEGWTEALILICTESLRRVDAVTRARQAEESAATLERHATLGRYMVEVRHRLNNALTCVLGNAELLLLEPGAFSAEVREQIETMHKMALRMHEILQRFSSLEVELHYAERESQPAQHAWTKRAAASAL